MKELREMTGAEVKALDGKMVIKVYSDFHEKLNGHETEYDNTPFAINTAIYGIIEDYKIVFKSEAVFIGKWYTDEDGLYIHKREYATNTVLDFICKGYSEGEARKMATNDKVTVTSIYKAA